MELKVADDNAMEQDIQSYEADQRLCNIANKFLNLLAEEHVSVNEVSRIFKRIQWAIDRSVENVRLETLACPPIRVDVSMWNQEEKVLEEIERRKSKAS